MKRLFILSVLLTLGLSFISSLQGQDESNSEFSPVNKVIHESPSDLKDTVLLIARFDLLDPETGVTGSRRKFIIEMNKAAKRSNSTLKETMDKSYNLEYKMASLSEVEDLRDQGYRYFVDMVLMPKQMDHPKEEAMIPSFIKYPTANKMYNNRNSQFHYYFYIRDLITDDAYLTTRFKGSADVYEGLKKFLRQVEKEITN